MGLFGKKKQKEEEVKPPVDSSLMILMETPKNGMVQYFAAMGIRVENTFYNAEDATFGIMGGGKCEHTRLVIIESGAGIFTRAENRKAIGEILAMTDNSEIDTTVFYTDTGLRNQLRKMLRDMCKQNKVDEPIIEYVEFESMMTVYKKFGEYNERYIADGAQDTNIENPLGYVAPGFDLPKTVWVTQYKDSQLFEVARDPNAASIIGYDVKF